MIIYNVTTLTLGSRSWQKGSQGRKPRKVWDWRFTLPSELSFWELESQWTPKPLESDCRGQNTSHWKKIYIIGKLLKCQCLQWLAWPVWTSTTQVMAKRKARSQIGNLILDHKKLEINLISMHVDGVQHIVEKLSMRATILFQTSFQSEG